jgi:hypothetical protein
MAGRGRTTFQKKQKEQLRLERRQQKAAKKLARKAEKHTPHDSEVQDETAPVIGEDHQPVN